MDLYADAQDGAVLWVIGGAVNEAGGDPQRARLRLRQRFPVTFYAAGPGPRLRALWRWLEGQSLGLRLSAVERRDLFQEAPLRLMAIEAPNPVEQERLFARAAAEFPDLTYYDADIPLALRHAAQYGTFPLAYLRLTVDEADWIQTIETLDSPWELDPAPVPLRILTLAPDCDPNRAAPSELHICCERRSYRLKLEPARPLLVNLRAILSQCDPDLIQSAWGDTWTLPHLLELAEKWGLALPLNRDPGREALRKRAHSYFTYGQVVHRGQQVHLFGRWHIDIYNAMMFHDYGLEGILESARVSNSPVQETARRSPGSGISAMQMVTALRNQVLTPWHKQQAEEPKSTLELIHADQGGLVYQPKVGLHRDVAEIDFISMYPGIMVRFNVSPETVRGKAFNVERSTLNVPALDLSIDQERPGLIPLTLEPLLEKRITLKQRLAELPKWDPRRKVYQAHAAAHKWLLVTCFGYLGYKNARFGRIEAHESVTAYSREALLRAKEAAEEQGFEVLHMYVDGLWVRKPGCDRVADVQPLLDEIVKRTRLPIAMEGIYRWVAFLPSRVNPKAPVANRYFGVFQDGSVKVRGIEARRGDAAPFVAEAQMHILDLLAQADDADRLKDQLPAVMAFLRRQVQALRAGRIPLEKLLVMQKLSRELELYRTPSPPARAAAQLAAIGKTLRAGQPVRFVYTLGEPGVHAWELPEPLDARRVDTGRYRTLLLRGAAAVLGPLGVREEQLGFYVLEQPAKVGPGGAVRPQSRLARGENLAANRRKILCAVDREAAAQVEQGVREGFQDYVGAVGNQSNCFAWVEV